MLPEWITLGGGAVGSLFAAKWLWRGAAIASLFKVVAVVLGALAILSLTGVVMVDVNGSRVVEVARFVWDLLPLGGLA